MANEAYQAHFRCECQKEPSRHPIVIPGRPVFDTSQCKEPCEEHSIIHTKACNEVFTRWYVCPLESFRNPQYLGLGLAHSELYFGEDGEDDGEKESSERKDNGYLQDSTLTREDCSTKLLSLRPIPVSTNPMLSLAEVPVTMRLILHLLHHETDGAHSPHDGDEEGEEGGKREDGNLCPMRSTDLDVLAMLLELVELAFDHNRGDDHGER